MQLYNKIREDNIIKYGTDASRIMKIIINQYSDRTHFIYEILQNAEDADATEISFKLYKDRLVIIHNGRLFNEKDIVGVCGIADGTKEDGTRIGHFGIGFKSVYGYTETPMIYSGDYHFKIVSQIYPEEIGCLDGINYNDTCMILPFNKSDVSEDIAYSEIKEALQKKINAESILMLNNISNIEIDIDGSKDIININKEKGPADSIYAENVFELDLMTSIINKSNMQTRIENNSSYLFFSDAEPEETAVIFKVDGKNLLPVNNTKIYAFFPTAKESHQNFYIHAPFDTTPARDNFKEGAEYGKHNIRLLNNIGELLRFAFVWLCDHGYLSLDGLNNVYPIYEYDKDDILYSIYENGKRIISDGNKILPTNQEGVFKSINEICEPENKGIVNVFDDRDLKTLLGGNGVQLYWLAKDISTVAYTNLRTYLKKNFTIRTVEWKDLVMKLTAFFLEHKDIEWFEKLFSAIETYCTANPHVNKSAINAEKIPFVRLNNGKHIYAREDGKLQVYLNNPDICKLRIEIQFLKSSIIRRFLEYALHIPEYNIERETVDKILPKYENCNVAFITNNHIVENIEDLKVIKDAIQVNPGIISQIENKYIVTDGNNWYRPSDLYIRSSDIKTGYSLVKDIVAIKYLANSYFDDTVLSIRLDEQFFKKIGCHNGIKEVHADKREYLSCVKKYIGSSEEDRLRRLIFSKNYVSTKIDWSFCYEGFSKIFENMTKEKSVKIARFLNPNTMNFDIQGEIVGADDQHFSGKNVDSCFAYTLIGILLCFEKWIYTVDSEEPQRVIDVEKSDIIDDYNAARRLMDMLPFKEVKNGLTDWLNETIADKSDRELIKRFLSKPEELTKVAKAIAKNEAKNEAKINQKRDIRDAINAANKQQTPVDSNVDSFEVTPISENAKEKRSEKLEKEFMDSLDQKIGVARNLRFASVKASDEERMFLQSEYNGYCQICGDTIVKHNGVNYFEAINIIKFFTLKEGYSKSEGLGWNSLCLCPNCAARYNYSSKRIDTICDQVMSIDVEAGSDEPIEIYIELPEGTESIIKYSPRHFMALKKAFEIFTRD